VVSATDLSGVQAAVFQVVKSYHMHACLVISQLCNLMDWSLPGSSVHGGSPGKNSCLGRHALPQGIFLTQRSNLHLMSPRWQAGSLPPAPRVKPNCLHREGHFLDQPHPGPPWGESASSDPDTIPCSHSAFLHLFLPVLLSGMDPCRLSLPI